MSISFMPYVLNTADNVWTIAPGCETDDDRFDINMCNANALDVLEALGYPDMSVSDEPVSIELFLDRTTRALRGAIDRPSPAQEIRTSNTDYGMAIIIGARTEGYVQKRLHQLAVMARESRANGATHIGWS
ncbi:hypothetical protein AruPA_20235 [Acidiphilium sp. PA]|uniref:hypothetical protein n=1 Tax=Acidiphilium sp. PA TaxID=2871705 RepID=UPI002244D10F|nr:hypothetical protein [Acidiphilium sp. PA]MCW8309355.1 hypothetical protein [Acidiphilium sp. PA]